MIRFAPLAILSATPALAHDGAHIHPHGADSLMGLALVALAVAGWMLYRSR